MNHYFKRILTVFLGTWITAIGVLLFLQSGKGLDPITTFVAGVINYVPLQFGTIIQIFTLSLVFLVFFLDKRIIGVGSFINAFFVGFFVNLFSPLFMSEVFSNINPYVYVLIAPLFIGIGVAIYLSADLGAASVESLMIYLSNRTKISIKVTRIAIDSTLVIMGILLGATYGIGTLLGIFMLGPVIEKTLQFLPRSQ